MRQHQKTKSDFPITSAPARGTARRGNTALSAREFFLEERDGLTMAHAARESGVAYATIYRHVMLRGGIRPETARKLEAWSKGAISAKKTLGFE